MSNVSKCFFCANKKDYDAKLGYFGCAYSGQECKKYSMFKPKVKPQPKSNAVRIRSMTDEELADFLGSIIHDWGQGTAEIEGADYVIDNWLDWLREECYG